MQNPAQGAAATCIVNRITTLSRGRSPAKLLCRNQIIIGVCSGHQNGLDAIAFQQRGGYRMVCKLHLGQHILRGHDVVQNIKPGLKVLECARQLVSSLKYSG